MNEDSEENGSLAESVLFERDLVEEGYSDCYTQGPDQYHYTLTLLPQAQEGEKCHVSVNLKFDSSPPYPKEALKCVVENNKCSVDGFGFTEHQIAELQGKVNETCKGHLNDLAVTHVIVLVQEFLTDHNHPPSSLHDDMQQRHNEQALMDNPSLFIEVVNKKVDKRSPPCIEPGTKKHFKSSSQSFCIMAVSEFEDTGTFSGIEIKNGEGKHYIIHEYIMTDLSSVKLKMELDNIQIEFNRNHRYLSHLNLLKYIALSTPISNNAVVSNVVHILTPLATPLSLYRLPYQNMKQLSKDLITGLQYLHNQGLYHGVLTINSIYHTQSGHHAIGDYGSAKKLLMNSAKYPFKSLEMKFSDVEREGGKDLDVLLLGHVIFHACRGVEPTSAYPTPPTDIEPLLREFIMCCVKKDKKTRVDLEELLLHKFIGDTPLPICETVTEQTVSFSTEGTKDSDVTAEHGDISEVWKRSPRLNNEYDIKELLGFGGFGSVIKVRNKLDGCFYAMKVVKLDKISSKAISSMRKEVKLLSQLKHNNIVRYNSTFIEKREDNDPISEKTNSETVENTISSGTSSVFENDHFAKMNNSLDDITFGECSFQKSEAEICRSKYHEDSSESDDGIVFERSRKRSQFTVSVTDGSPTSCHINEVIVMYIQMEFCENTTLLTLMKDTSMVPRLHENKELVLRVLRQIVDALEYIHALDIIHRDLKPANIFLDSKDTVKIGDFGLAMSGGSKMCGSVVGTSLYIAPEVKSERRYTTLIDIYSLGVITFEMVRGPFDTDSERLDVINGIRNEEVDIPSGVFEDEKLEELARAMLSHDRKMRPTAAKIADNEILPPRLAEQGLHEILRHINAETGSDRRALFMKTLFNNDIANAVQRKYDSHNKPDTESQTVEFTRTMNDIIDSMTKIFLNHGAVQCPLPFLLPKCDLTDRQDRPFTFLSKTGYFQVLPCNLKLNLARHIIKNKIENQKRYGFSQVFRKRLDKDKNPNPKDILEGCFDVISTGSPIIAKSEVFLTVLEVLRSIPNIDQRRKIVYINHAKIMKAILLFYKIEEFYHEEILKLLCDSTENHAKLSDKLRAVCDTLNERQLTSLLGLLKHEGPFDNLYKDPYFNVILYKSKDGKQLREGLIEILQVLIVLCSDKGTICDDIMDPNKNVDELSETLSKMPQYINHIRDLFKMRPGVVNDPCCYSDLTFQVVIENPDDCKLMEVIAVGGDFQCLLEQWTIYNKTDSCSEKLPSAFGVNFLLEVMVSVISGPYSTKVLVVSDPSEDNNVDVFTMIRKLWENNIKTEHMSCHEYEESSYKAVHVIKFSKGSITIDSDQKFMKTLKGDCIPNFTKFKSFKSEEALAYLLYVGMCYEESELSKRQKAFRSNPDIEGYFDEWDSHNKKQKKSQSTVTASPKPGASQRDKPQTRDRSQGRSVPQGKRQDNKNRSKHNRPGRGSPTNSLSQADDQ